MKLQELTNYLESWAPKSHAESFDNVGLLLGDPKKTIRKSLVCLDVTEDVVEEAIETQAELIISFHPLIFSGLKNLRGNSRIERCVVQLIKNDIALYAIHTNLDNQLDGVNKAMCDALDLINRKILIPKNNNLFQLTFFSPSNNTQDVKDAIYKAGGGSIGDYKNCSFQSEGTGTFLPIGNAKPTIGTKNTLEQVQEDRVEILIEKSKLNDCISAMKKAHIYEEVAYNVFPLQNTNQDLGMGQIGELKEPMQANDFLSYLKKSLPTGCIRHSAIINKPITKVAVLGGSGAFAIQDALQAKADCFVTADLKYHDFFKAESKILLCDVGHYESEQFTINLIAERILKKFPNFVVLKTEIQTNPVNYF